MACSGKVRSLTRLVVVAYTPRMNCTMHACLILEKLVNGERLSLEEVHVASTKDWVIVEPQFRRAYLTVHGLQAVHDYRALRDQINALSEYE